MRDHEMEHELVLPVDPVQGGCSTGIMMHLAIILLSDRLGGVTSVIGTRNNLLRVM